METTNISTITPSVFYRGNHYVLTGKQWLLMYAMAGFQWAIDALEDCSNDEPVAPETR